MYLLYHIFLLESIVFGKIYDIGRLYPTTQMVVGFTLPFYKNGMFFRFIHFIYKIQSHTSLAS